MKLSWLDRNIKWVFVLPSVLFVLIMMTFPIFYVLRISFFEWSMSAVTPPQWVGLANFKALFADARFWHSIRVTFYFSGLALVVEIILGVIIALLFSRDFKGQSAAKTLLLLPMVSTPVAMAFVWKLIFEPTIGLANYLITSLGMKPLVWLGSTTQVIPSLAIIDIWHWTPMIAIIVIAGRKSLPTDPYESASIDGATSWQKFTRITLPLLRPTIMIAALLRLVDVLKEFDIIYATTEGGPSNASETLNLYGYITGFEYFKLGSASSMLMVLFMIVLLMTLVLVWMRKKWGTVE